MNRIKASVSVLLVAVFTIVTAGCFLSGDVSSAFENAAKSYGIEKYEKRADLIRATAKLTEEGSGYYVSKDEKEATSQSRSYLSAKAKDIEASEYRYIAIRENGDKKMQTCSAFTITYKTKDDAAEVYDSIKKGSGKNLESGEKGSYSYYISAVNSSTLTIRGIYLEGKNITVIQALSGKGETNAFAEHFFKKMNYISPMVLIED